MKEIFCNQQIMQLQSKILMPSRLQKRYQGSFSKIYLGTDKQTKERVAIKIISKYQHKDEILFELFRKEHAALKQFMGVKTIVKMFDFHEDASSFIFVMEFCHCDILSLIREVLHVDVLPANIAIYFIQEVTMAMSHIHEAGYLHRDVKLENMLVQFQSDEDFQYLSNQEIPEIDRLDRLDSLIPTKIRIVLTDFGFVRKYTGTIVGTLVGSPIYMSPEILDGEQYEKPADVYALGLCFYEMCVGKHPFEFSRDLIRHSNNIKENWKNIFTGQEGNEVPYALQQTIKMMLHFNPRLRLQLSDLKHAIEQYEQAQKINPNLRSQLLLDLVMEQSQQLQFSHVKLQDPATNSQSGRKSKIQLVKEDSAAETKSEIKQFQELIQQQKHPQRYQLPPSEPRKDQFQQPISKPSQQPEFQFLQHKASQDPQQMQTLNQRQGLPAYPTKLIDTNNSTHHLKTEASQATKIAESAPTALLRETNQAIVKQPLLTKPQQEHLPQIAIDVPQAVDDAQIHQLMDVSAFENSIVSIRSLAAPSTNVSHKIRYKR